ncbi:hypothetical protein [Kitasatospora griseola]|uniref:hypothetical protein n=1 Tax=Kitasatospora griseola TaxID=2064 RepID=UPI00341743BD
MPDVLSPIVSERIWALPISAASVKFLNYLIAKSLYGGEIPVLQKDMATEYGKTPQGISALMAPLCELKIVLRPQGEQRDGNRYRLHPCAAKYESAEALEDAFREALALMKARKLPALRLPTYQIAPPPAGTERPDLRVA